MNRNDGGPAFPFHHVYESGEAREGFGMTLRDYFAGQALSGLLANETGHRGLCDLAEKRNEAPATTAAIVAYEYADAMLAERAK